MLLGLETLMTANLQQVVAFSSVAISFLGSQRKNHCLAVESRMLALVTAEFTWVQYLLKAWLLDANLTWISVL